jgi:hypothetical protein
MGRRSCGIYLCTLHLNLSQDARAEEKGTGGAVSQDEAEEEPCALNITMFIQ